MAICHSSNRGLIGSGGTIWRVLQTFAVVGPVCPELLNCGRQSQSVGFLDASAQEPLSSGTSLAREGHSGFPLSPGGPAAWSSGLVFSSDLGAGPPGSSFCSPWEGGDLCSALPAQYHSALLPAGSRSPVCGWERVHANSSRDRGEGLMQKAPNSSAFPNFGVPGVASLQGGWLVDEASEAQRSGTTSRVTRFFGCEFSFPSPKNAIRRGWWGLAHVYSQHSCIWQRTGISLSSLPRPLTTGGWGSLARGWESEAGIPDTPRPRPARQDSQLNAELPLCVLSPSLCWDTDQVAEFLTPLLGSSPPACGLPGRTQLVEQRRFHYSSRPPSLCRSLLCVMPGRSMGLERQGLLAPERTGPHSAALSPSPARSLGNASVGESEGRQDARQAARCPDAFSH